MYISQVTDEMLREAFSKYGTITSAKVMRDEAGVSKGFGFVCFVFPEDATKAVTAMNLKIFMKKPLYVGLAEKRDHRVARLQQRFRLSARPNSSSMMMAGHPNAPQHPQVMNPYGGPPQMYFGGPQGSMGSRPMAGPGFAPPSGSAGMAWRQQGARPYGAGPQGGPQMATPSYPYHPMGPVNPMGTPASSGLPLARGSVGPRPRGGMGGQTAANMSQGAQPNFKFTPQARNRDYPQVQHPGHGQPAAPQQPLVNDSMINSGDLLSAQSLAAAHPLMQKQMLGEKLFPLVAKHQPELAGKITGMMLEMDNAELLSLLESESQLRAKVDEALGVLHRHQAIAPPTTQSPSINPI